MFKIRIENNEIVPINPVQSKLFKAFVSRLNNTGKVLNIHFDEESDDITDKQKNLYSAIVIRIADDTGNDFKTVDDHFKKFLPKEVKGTAFSQPELCQLAFDSLNKPQYESFLESVIQETKEFFGMNLRLEYDNNNQTKIIIKK